MILSIPDADAWQSCAVSASGKGRNEMGNNEMGIGEYIAGWFAHNGNVTGGVWFAIFIVLLLVKPKKDVKTILLLLPKIAGTYVVFC